MPGSEKILIIKNSLGDYFLVVLGLQKWLISENSSLH